MFLVDLFKDPIPHDTVELEPDFLGISDALTELLALGDFGLSQEVLQLRAIGPKIRLCMFGKTSRLSSPNSLPGGHGSHRRKDRESDENPVHGDPN